MSLNINANPTVALLKAGALQSAIFNSANFSSIATDANGVIQIFNVGAERMLGFTAAEVINIITPADISDPQELIARAETLTIELGTEIKSSFDALVFKASRGIEDIYELTYIRKDGSRFPAVVSVTALRDVNESIIGYLLIGTDNTARKQAEIILQETEVFKRAILNSLAAEIAVIDLDGVIREVNTPWKNAAYEYSNNNPTEFDVRQIGLNYLEFSKSINSSHRMGLDAYNGIQAVLKGSLSSFNMEYACHSPTKQRWFMMSVLPLGHAKIKGAVIAHTDITGYKELDQALQEKNCELERAKFVAEKANLAKSDFLSSMSHELRSPLNAILGFAQLMETDLPPPSASQHESISQILQAGWHLLILINEILDLAKIEAQQISLHLEPVLINDIMLECKNMMENEAKKRGVSVSLPIDNLPILILADRTRVKQVVINLLSNSIKYNRKYGKVEIEYKNVKSDRIRISFKDNGLGLSEDQIAQLYQPFNRLNQETGSQEGTGIGLVVAKRLLELMGGSVGVESEIGIGSTFWFEVAAADKPCNGCSLVKANTTKLSGKPDISNIDVTPTTINLKKLLYIEDNPANMKLVERIIARDPNLKLLTATNGIDGVEIAQKTNPDLILMDINLPGISGLEALKMLQLNTITSNIPVIAISANAMLTDVNKGLSAGFVNYISKPIKVDELIKVINSALTLVK